MIHLRENPTGARSPLACIVLVALIGAGLPATAAPQTPPAESAETEAAPEPPEGRSRLLGSVNDTEGKPVGGVTILAFHLETEETLRSTPTDKRGRFEITELRLGYYAVAVEAPDGLFVGSTIVNMPPSGKAILTLTLTPFSPTNDYLSRDFPGSETPGDGIAEVVERLTKKEFFRSPKGVAVLAGAGGIALLSFATSDNTETIASPF